VVWKIVVPIALVVVAVVVVLAVAGGDSKSDEALAQVCGARADISQQLKTLQGLTPGSAREQGKASLQAIADDLKTIAGARADLSDARRGEVQSANDTFVASVKDAGGSVTDLASLQTAAGDVKAAAQKLAQTYAATYGKIDCNEA
jgi:hypothetical protein